MEKRWIPLALFVFVFGLVAGNLGTTYTGQIHAESPKVNTMAILSPGASVPASSNIINVVAYAKLCLASADCDPYYKYKQSYMFQPPELYMDGQPKGQMTLNQKKDGLHSVVEYWYSKPLDLKYLRKGTHKIKVVGYTTFYPLGEPQYTKTYTKEQMFTIV